MKTKFLVFGLTIFLSYSNAMAQWATNGSSITYTNRSVGVGTSIPQQELHIMKVGQNADLRLQRSGSQPTDFYSGSTGAGIWSYGTKYLRFATNTTERMRITGGGFVGIGVTNPVQELHVVKVGQNADLRLQQSGSQPTDFYSGNTGAGIWSYGTKYLRFGTNTTERMRITSGGNVGIGTSNPSEKLHVNGNAKIDNNLSFGATTRQMINLWNSSYGIGVQSNTQYFRTGNHFAWYRNGSHTNAILNPGTGGTALMVLRNTGNLGIGTSNPGTWKLAVNGNIRAKEVKVETGWSDFVFYDDYKLPTLQEVEKHIKEKGHLKDIPSAKEVEKNGIFLGEMDAKLLQKIEELTLYIIDQNKKIENMYKEIELLKK